MPIAGPLVRLHSLATQVSAVLQRRIGAAAFTARMATAQRATERRRTQRRTRYKELVINAPDVAARKRIKRQLSKVEATKRRMLQDNPHRQKRAKTAAGEPV